MKRKQRIKRSSQKRKLAITMSVVLAGAMLLTGTFAWWLRSPGGSEGQVWSLPATRVGSNGSIVNVNASGTRSPIRPALWVSPILNP
ncbi:MAG: DUF6273 domain-containing protein [Lachnospiraceae bacterium]|nr:DUF6273 domain-containing protein [Lachnospiraceae bacterium]